MKNRKEKSGSLNTNGIGKRLVVVILLFSSLITLILTSFQLYLDFRRDVNTIESRLQEVKQSHVQSLAASLWNLDVGLLHLQMEGLVRLPDMVGVEINEISNDQNSPLRLTFGNTHIDNNTIHREYSLLYSEAGQEPRQIGLFRIYASLDGVYARLFDKALLILASQGVKTFLVTLFILLVVHRIITRHLFTISSYLTTLNFISGTTPLHLERKSNHEDELALVVKSINRMRESLESAYSELQNNTVILEKRVKERTAELELANSELDSFAYTVSHDLKAPLRAINGFSDLLIVETKDKLNDEEKNYLQQLKQSSHDMATLINGLLVLSSSTRGGLSLETVDLSATVKTIIDNYQLEESSSNVSCDIKPALTATGDPALLKTMLENLIGNAWKYSKNTKSPKIIFDVEYKEDNPVFFVKDNGAGFDMAHIDKLFQPFKRLHKSDEFQGIGIGLATVQRIIHRHGGQIWAKAERGKGATFFFTLS
ncbi:MAG: GHKL domain-containing protein [Magnetococcales bacterium]|nr:GHKL domain-containing protein [Magnetococcales bacterium]